MSVAFVYGTRAEAIKVGPIVAELRNLGLRPELICTGQHWSLLAGTPAENDLRDSVSLGLPSTGAVGMWVAKAVLHVQKALLEVRATSVVVQGDTMSVLAGAWAARRLGIPVIHVEAGIRSGNLEEPYPEERIRRGVARIAELHLCATVQNAANLRAEGVPESRIRVTGNSVVSALARYTLNGHFAEPLPHVLVTMHRREWLETGEKRVIECIQAVSDCADRHPHLIFQWPMHPGVAEIVRRSKMPAPRKLLVTEPLPYRRMAKVLAQSIGIATDSGGLQEEAAALGVPCAVLRNVTDRPESIQAGVARRFDPTPAGITQAISTLLASDLPRKRVDCYGTSDAAVRIAREIAQFGVRSGHVSPT